MLNNLQNDETNKVITMLEANLEAESNPLRDRHDKSTELKEIMKQVEDYNNHFRKAPTHDKTLQLTQ